MNNDTTLISKLGTMRGVERSRIWIEGQRLTAAGFKVGHKFIKRWSKGKLVLYAVGIANDDDEIGTVSGKGEKPLIDIVGKKVLATFPDATHVKVRYDADRKCITITGVKQQ